MAWNLDDSRPIWPQLKEIMTMEIVSGKYQPGDPFPTVRELAEQAKVNRNTMQRALSELENDGMVITNRTAGRTVTEDNELIEKCRNEIAKNIVLRTFEELKQLGYERDDVIKLIESDLRSSGDL